MQENLTKKKLRAGDRTFGCFCRYANADIAEFLAMQGFDCFMLARKAADAYRQLQDCIRIHHVDIPWLGFKVTHIPYERLARVVGRSQYTFSKRIVGALNGILNSSVWPIRLISVAGISISFLGFIYAAMIVHRAPRIT